MAGATKIEFLRRVIEASLPNHASPVLMTYDDYVRDNVRIAAEALQLRLVRLASDPDGLGYQIRITPGGRFLASGDICGAAAAIDRGSVATRIIGPEPFGPIGARIVPGEAPVSLRSGLIRTNTPEVLRGIATGHLHIDGDFLRACDPKTNRGGSLRTTRLGTSSLAARNLGGNRRIAQG